MRLLIFEGAPLKLPSDVLRCRRLQNEHRVLNGEIIGYGDKLLTEELATAQQLIDASHHAAPQIADIMEKLKAVYQELKVESDHRLQFLKVRRVCERVHA